MDVISTNVVSESSYLSPHRGGDGADWAQWPDDDLIAITGVLSPHLVLAALHEGVFPMPITGDEVPRELRGATAWWSPMRRGILLPGQLKVARSLRKTTKHHTAPLMRSSRGVQTRRAPMPGLTIGLWKFTGTSMIAGGPIQLRRGTRKAVW